MQYGIDFNIGDQVSFGVRHSNGVKKGGIARISGLVIDYTQWTSKPDLVHVKANGRLYNLRELKGGWVVETERNDPKGRLYMAENLLRDLEAAE
jgi:hypothetical protein